MTEKKSNFNMFLLLWSGELIASIGSGLTAFGLGIYVFQQTGLASSVSLITLLAFLPNMLLTAPAGVLADRYDRRLLMILGDGLSALGLVFILFFMMTTGSASLSVIAIGVAISSVFTSLLEPSYRATITDLLTVEEFSKASGLVQLAGSAKFLISPILAGFLLARFDISLLLIIDICTLFLTILASLVVKKNLVSKAREKTQSFIKDFKDGWKALVENRGLVILLLLSSLITFFIGFIQTLSTPLLLAFTTPKMIGSIETFAALGMLISSLFLGMKEIKKGFVKMLVISLFCAGLCISIFGLRENLVLIAISGFFFFSCLPFANTAMDFLVRTNIDNEQQGRIWGLMDPISSFGYIIAYAVSGLLADFVFRPLLLAGGLLAGSLGTIFGIGSGRGTGLLISVSGIFLSLTALLLLVSKSLRKLES
jgi:MFS family permease